MIAASVLSVSLMASLRSQIASVQLMKEARATEVAVEILNEAMAQALLQTNAELVDEGGVLGPGAPMTTSEVLTDQQLSYTLPGYTAGDPVPACLTVRMRLAWTSASGIPRTMDMLGAQR